MDYIPPNIRCRKCKEKKDKGKFTRYLRDVSVGLNPKCNCDDCRKWIPGAYEERNRNIRVLGFRSYGDYLSSHVWKTIRAIVLGRDGGKCHCGAPASEVHHHSYTIDVLVGKNLSQLVSLCRKHHEEIEFSDNQKNTLDDARSKARKMGMWVPKIKPVAIPEHKMSLRQQQGEYRRNEKLRIEMETALRRFHEREKHHGASR